MKSRIPKFQKDPKPWKTLGSRKIVDLGEVKLYQDRILSKSRFETNHLRLSLHDFSIIVPVLHRDHLVFVWNYRYPIHGWELELPAGLVDDGEDPETSAKRELKEETGYSGKTWKKLGWLHTLPGISSQRVHVYLTSGLRKGKTRPEPYEHMMVKILQVDEAYRLLRRGRLVHSPTVAALGLAQKAVLGEEASNKDAFQ